MKRAIGIILSVLLAGLPVHAAHYKLFVLTGQSNSLGTTNGSESDVSPGTDAADSRVKFFWSNVADVTTSLGDSGGVFTDLQAQQGGYYPGSATHWGPEIGFARTLVRAGVENIAVVKASRGGGGNTNWSKSSGGHMYSQVVNTVSAAANALTANGDTFETAGLLYLQGESDSTAEAAISGTRFKELVDNLRADLPNATTMHAVVGGIAAAGADRDTVRAQQSAIAAATPYIDDFSNLDLQAEVTDGLHFNKAAKLRIGSRFAQAFLGAGTVTRHYGKLAFIGDSITQGGNGYPGYRYTVFSHLAQQGVPADPVTGYQFVGSVNGAYGNNAGATPDVNGQTFSNTHDGHYGWRAFWINARVRLPANRRDSNRGEGTLLNWTDQVNPQKYLISSPDANVNYPDPTASGTGNTGTTYVPDTAVVMIGINDLGDDNNSANQVVADIGTIIDQLRASNPSVRIHVNRLLYTNQTQAMHDAVDAVNSQLTALADTKNAASATSPVWVIDASTGFDPVTMTHDNVHPNTNGEHHVGDRIAAALGIIEDPLASAAAPPPHVEQESSSFNSGFEGNDIWDGSAYVNSWTQTGSLTKTLPDPTDLKVVNPGGGGAWIEGSATGWDTANDGDWTFETRLKFDANANGFIVWLGTGSQRILVEVYGDRTQDNGGETFNVSHDNLDGQFHTFRIAHDADHAKYHVWRDAVRLTPLDGVAYDAVAADSRMIMGDYTSGTFGNNFNVTIDYVRYDQSGAWLPPGADADVDGMPDSWEYTWFSTITDGDPAGNPDDDAFSNLQEYQNGTNPLVADGSAGNVLGVHLLTGEGNALGSPSTTTLHSLPPGEHPAEKPGGVWFNDGSGWTALSAAPDGSFGPELAFARLLWDAGCRNFGIVKSAAAAGGNTLWQKGGGNDSAYQSLVASATSAAGTPPAGYDSVTFNSLLYVQGESNDATEAGAADTRLTELAANLRGDLPSAAGMDVIIGVIGGSGADRDTTRARHAALAAANNDVGLAAGSGLAVHNLDGLGIHYDADSLFLLGSRMAAEVLRMNLAGTRPLPAWENLHAWYVADHAAGFDANGAVSRWGAMQDGTAIRDLARRVSGQVFRTGVTANGELRQVMRFDGTNDLWANATNEFGAISGNRSVAVLCRLINSNNGYVFDGSTGSGRTRAQARGGKWQAGVSGVWDEADPDTDDAITGTWQQHVFTYSNSGSNTAVNHWIDGVLVATTSDTGTSNLGGMIIGSNGGSPFTRSAVDVAEVAVYDSVLGVSEVSALKSAWDTRWGTITLPPFSASVSQTSRQIPRFGRHELLKIEVNSQSSGTTTLDEIRVEIAAGSRSAARRWSIHSSGSSPAFSPSSTPLAAIDAPASDTLVFPIAVSLVEGTNYFWLAADPERNAPLGSVIDAEVLDLTVSGDEAGTVVPANADPAGQLTLALVPLFNDVRVSGEGGINTYRIPGIVCDSSGVLHAVYDHRYNNSADLPANVDVGYSRSSDGGATWTPSEVIMDFDSSEPGSSGNGVGDPCILHDPVTDTLWVAALWSFGNNGYNGSGAGTEPADTGQYVLTKSTDGGLTWSAAINVTVAVKDDPNWRLIFQGPGHGLAMRDGTLVFPSQYRDSTGTVRVCSVFSTDHGATWDFGSGVPTASPQTNENTVCELDDGRLLFSMRTPSGSNGQRAWIHYTPGGATPMRDGTWDSLFRLPAVPDPVCQGSVIQWTSTHRGDPREFVLFGNPASSSSRTNFTLRVSPDGGATWPVSRLLYAGSGGYSSICILPDKSIGVLFEKDNYTKMTFARVEADWLMNPAVDVDEDDMPDAWETLHGLNPAVNDSALDPDGDGVDNLREYLAGTDPQSAVSVLRATSLAPGTNSWEFGWQAVPGKSYAIETSADLSNWDPAGEVLADSAAMKVTVSTPGEPAKLFFRAVVLP